MSNDVRQININSRKRNNTDAFVSSMAFANKVINSGNFGESVCDCSNDECRRFGALPVPIAEAVRNYKLSRLGGCNYQQLPSATTKFAIPLMFHPKKPKQVRQLMTRTIHGIAMWKLAMPCDAEPLLEYGSTHRLVYVKKLPHNSKIVSIGRGIYGSSMEEKERVQMKWKEGGWYLLPSNGGVSLGWIHKHQGSPEKVARIDTSDHDNSHDNNGLFNPEDAIVIVVKLPLDLTSCYDENRAPIISNQQDEDKTEKIYLKTFLYVLDSYLRSDERAHGSNQVVTKMAEIGRFGGNPIAEEDHPKLLQALLSLMPS